MSTTAWFVLVIVVLVLVAGAAIALMSNRRRQARREEAQHLRTEAAESTTDVDASRREAEEAAARAEVARAEAARAEKAAAEAQQSARVEEARVEDRVRTADRVDPDVDHRSDDYRPEFPDERATTDETPEERRDDTRYRTDPR